MRTLPGEARPPSFPPGAKMGHNAAAPRAPPVLTHRTPRAAREAALVAHPSYIGAHVAEHHRIRLHGANHVPGARPIVVRVLIDRAFLARPAVETVAAVGAIVPHLEDGAVSGEQFAELRAINLEVD